MQKTVSLQLGREKIILAAEGSKAERSLLKWADLTGLRESPDSAGGYDFLLTDKIPPGEAGHCRTFFPCLPFLMNEQSVVMQHDPTLKPWLSGEWQLMQLLAVLKKMKQTGRVFLMHGALLELAPGEGTILFGHSGVGKSTTALRVRMAGGRCRSDDVILCTLNDGELSAAPFPTPSYLREYYTPDLYYPFYPGLKVKNLIHLCRGETEERLVDIPENQWFPPLIHSLTFHFTGLFQMLPDAPAYGNLIFDIALRLAKLFPRKSCEAHWSGNIIQTLTGENV